MEFAAILEDLKFRVVVINEAIAALEKLQTIYPEPNPIHPEPLEIRKTQAIAAAPVERTKQEKKRLENKRYRDKLKQIASTAAGAAKVPAASIAPSGSSVSATHELPTHKPCTLCGVDKPLEEFTVSENGRYGRSSHCKKCKNEKMAAYRKTTPHIAVDEQDKPNQCDKCGKRFMALGSLILHRKDNCPMRQTA
jgi:hypothetical protein